MPKELNASSGIASSMAVTSSANSKQIDSSRMLLSRIQNIRGELNTMAESHASQSELARETLN